MGRTSLRHPHDAYLFATSSNAKRLTSSLAAITTRSEGRASGPGLARRNRNAAFLLIQCAGAAAQP
jgi:hypothetical protein